MARGRPEQEAVRLEQAVSAFVERIQGVPAGLLTRAPAPGEWSPMELAAHSAEIYGYWAGQIAQIRDKPGQPFGRTMADPQRIRFVEEHRSDALETLVATIQRDSAAAAATLRAFTEEEWRTVTGLHSARGQMHMDAISDLFLAGHAEEHLKQLDQTLAMLGPRSVRP